MTESDLLGPVGFLAVEFPPGELTGTGFRLLRTLVDRGVIAVLDLQFLAKDQNGSLTTVAVEDVPHQMAVDLSPWQGLNSGILDEEDLASLGDAITPGSLAGILVYENLWAVPIMQEILNSGARLLGEGRIDSHDLMTVLGMDDTPGDGAD